MIIITRLQLIHANKFFEGEINTKCMKMNSFK